MDSLEWAVLVMGATVRSFSRRDKKKFDLAVKLVSSKKITSVSNFALISRGEWLSLSNGHKSFLIRLISNRTHFWAEVAVSLILET